MMERKALTEVESKQPNYDINPELKRILQELNLSIPTPSIVDLQTHCGMDLQTVKELYPDAKTIAITKEDNKEKLKQRFNEVLAINIERDCLPFPAKSIDIILAGNVLNQATEVLWVIHEVTRSLRIAGYLIINIPHKNSEKFKSKQAIIDFLNRGFANGYEIIFTEKNKYHYLPNWLAQIATFLFPGRASTKYMVLQKTQPYVSGFLDYKISLDSK